MIQSRLSVPRSQSGVSANADHTTAVLAHRVAGEVRVPGCDSAGPADNHASEWLHLCWSVYERVPRADGVPSEEPQPGSYTRGPRPHPRGLWLYRAGSAGRDSDSRAGPQLAKTRR